MQTNLLKNCQNKPNVGGFERLRLGYSAQIIQQRFQTDSEIVTPIEWIDRENWICDWRNNDSFLLDIKINEETVSFPVDMYSIKVLIDTDENPISFSNWWRKTLKNKSVFAELTNNNGFLRIVNPFHVSYTYNGDSNYAGKNTYELLFTRVRLREQKINISLLPPKIDCCDDNDMPQLLFPEIYCTDADLPTIDTEIEFISIIDYI